jgi:hypothetical protein
MPRDAWPDDGEGGFLKDGVAHCCRGCAEGTGCTCARELSDELGDAVTDERTEQRPTGRKLAPAAAGRAREGDRAPTEEEIRADRASGDFVQSLQKETKTVEPEDYGTEVTEGPPPRTASND